MPLNTPKKNNYIIPLLIIAILIVICAIGFGVYLMKYSAPKTAMDTTFFDSEIASVSGKVTEINEKVITVENKKGKIRSFPVSQAFTVMSTSEEGFLVPSNELAKVTPGSEYLINLALGPEGTLEITNIMPTAVPPMPPIEQKATVLPSPTIASRSAAPAATPANTNSDDNSDQAN